MGVSPWFVEEKIRSRIASFEALSSLHRSSRGNGQLPRRQSFWQDPSASAAKWGRRRNGDNMTNATATSWLEVDIIGLRRTLERKGKAWAIFELVQNSWDTDATQVEVTLTKPNKNGMSTLTCRDIKPLAEEIVTRV
jgi:hypothetical protein